MAIADSFDFSIFADWPERVYVKDESRQFIFANQAAQAAAGEIELLGKRDEDLFQDQHLNQARADEEALLAGKIPGGIIQREEMETWKDKQLRWVRTIKKLIPAISGRPAMILGITRELSVVEREAFLKKLCAIQRSDSQTQGGELFKIDDDRGCYHTDWKSPIVKDPCFASHFRTKKRINPFSDVHKHDVDLILGHLQEARDAGKNPKHVGIESAVDFRVKDKGRDVWLRAFWCVLTINGKPRTIASHRVIDRPNVGEHLAKQLEQHFPGYIFVKNEAFRFKFMNKALLQDLNKKELADVLNRTDEEIGLRPNEIQEFLKADQQIINSTDTDKTVLRLREPITIVDEHGAEQKHELVTIKMPLDPQAFEPGQRHDKPHILGISVKITDIWRKLRDAERLWVALLDSATDAVYLKDANSLEYVAVNDVFCRLCGKPREEILGKKAREVWIHNLDGVSEMEQQDQMLLHTQATQHAGCRRTRLSNGDFQLRTTAKMLLKDESDKPWRIFGVSRNSNLAEPGYYFQMYAGPRHPWSNIENLPGLERRRATVLFCDIRQFSTFAHEFDGSLEILVDFLSRFYQFLVGLTWKHQCIFNSFQGDGALIVGVDLSGADPDGLVGAERAADLALEMVREFPNLVKQWEDEHPHDLVRIRKLRLAVGMHVGDAAVGFLRGPSDGNGEGSLRMEFSAVGDTVNVGQRYESLAGKEDGDIIVSAPLKKLLEGKFRFRLRGKRVPSKETYELRIFELEGRRD